jgi:ribonuclease PH
VKRGQACNLKIPFVVTEYILAGFRILITWQRDSTECSALRWVYRPIGLGCYNSLNFEGVEMRIDGRSLDEIRKVNLEVGLQEFAEGSCLIQVGKTKVICSASVNEGVPPFLKLSGQGWVTAEYAMLPRSTLTRTPRRNLGAGGRESEIQRLIGRSLRAVMDLKSLGERTVVLDCDVIQADGGTRTASITGAYIAMYQALSRLVQQGKLTHVPVTAAVAATSVGVIEGVPHLDLCYEEDASAEVDFNVVMTDAGDFVELQATAEGIPFSQESIDNMLALARKGIGCLFEEQMKIIGSL